MKKSFSNSIIEYKKTPISAKITSYEIYTESSFLGSKYVVFKVKITTFYKIWTLCKRYSDFENLHKSLSIKLKGLPEFPPKRLFKISEDTIQERKTMFENYLNTLFKNVNIYSYPEIIEFIEIDKDLLVLFVKNNTMIETNSSAVVNRYYSMRKINSIETKSKSVDASANRKSSDNYYNSFLEYKLQASDNRNQKSANMMVIEEFLRNLEFKFENKCEIVKTFEQFLKSKTHWPHFRSEEIMKLLNGDCSCIYYSGNSAISAESENSFTPPNSVKGLMHHVGSIDQNILGAEACLEFLGKLIDYEFNPECEAYIIVLKTSKLENILSMRLNEHIDSNKMNISIICYRILKIIIGDHKVNESKLKKLINDGEILNKFLIWYENNKA